MAAVIVNAWEEGVGGRTMKKRTRTGIVLLMLAHGLAVCAKHVVHPERSKKNGVATHPFSSEEAPDEAPS